MKREVLRTISCLFIITALMALSGCRNIFHSKEKIDYIDLVIDSEHTSSLKKGKRNYYKLPIEKGTKYKIECHAWVGYSNDGKANSWSYLDSSFMFAVFFYDTEEQLVLKKSGSSEKSISASFTASRSGDIVIRVTSGSYSFEEYTIKCSIVAAPDI